MSQEINIWVSNLGKYNEGILQGAWFTLPTEMSEIRKKIGLNERYEEWAIHDYEAPFKISEYDDIGTLNEIAELIEETEIPDVVWNNMSELLDYFSGSVPDLIENCEPLLIHSDLQTDYYLGQAYIEDLDVEFPRTYLGNTIESYIDYKSLGRDIALSSQGKFLDGCWVEYIG